MQSYLWQFLRRKPYGKNGKTLSRTSLNMLDGSSKVDHTSSCKQSLVCTATLVRPLTSPRHESTVCPVDNRNTAGTGTWRLIFGFAILSTAFHEQLPLLFIFSMDVFQSYRLSAQPTNAASDSDKRGLYCENFCLLPKVLRSTQPYT